MVPKVVKEFRGKCKEIISTDHALLALILVAGAILRCYHWQDIPFTHDEYSALIRTQFSTFHDLIEKGVMPDGHPAGVQVFLYYWTHLFGTSEWIVKVPFQVMGLLSVALIYKIGKTWFSATTGLVAAAFLSFLQFPVMYSQIARPYASGLFFSLLMVLCWTFVLFTPERKKILTRAGYVVAASLCTYNHHFSMLFAAMAGVTGLFFCTRQTIKPYLLLNLAVILLYIPHLPIFMNQLETGGVEGWLQKPRFDFLIDHIHYIFHFSVYIMLLLFLLILLQVIWYEYEPPINQKFLVISLIWFLFPFLTGYLYSRLFSSVLQHSVLIFSFPFLLFLLSGFFKTEKPAHQWIAVGLVAMIVIPSLVVERQHYKLFYHHPYREFVRCANQQLLPGVTPVYPVIIATPEKIHRWYTASHGFGGSRYIFEDSILTKISLKRCLDTITGDYVGYGSLPSSCWENYQLIREKFPRVLLHETFSGGDFYLFSRNPETHAPVIYHTENIQDFEKEHPFWNNLTPTLVVRDHPLNGRASYAMADTLEFSPTFSYPLRSLVQSQDDVIDVSVTVKIPPVFPGGWLVTAVNSGNRTLFWRSVSITEYVKPGGQGKVFISFHAAELDWRHRQLMFSTYLWNPKKIPFELDDFTVQVRSGNPVLYGLFRPVK